MYTDCPTCGNGIVIAKRQQYGRCPYCNQKYHVIAHKKCVTVEAVFRKKDEDELSIEAPTNI